jgi:hypothetical protein
LDVKQPDKLREKGVLEIYSMYVVVVGVGGCESGVELLLIGDHIVRLI